MSFNKKNLISCLKLFFVATPLIILFIYSCNVNNDEDNNTSPCPPYLIVSTPPYDSPCWHPGGEFIGFNYTPLIKITYPYGEQCQGEYEWNSEMSGFWLINTDGTNLRRILPYKLQTPTWSRDGEWVSFVAGAQIFKMQFTGETFDTTTITQLTFDEGRNFFPAWSPDGQWIAYNKSICDGPNTCGIWFMDANGQQHEFLDDYGNYPDWYPLEMKIIYRVKTITQDGLTIGDSLWSCNTNTKIKSFLTFIAGDNRNPKYSFDGEKIAFWSSGNIWLMDSVGNNKQQLTTAGVDIDFGTPFSWSPDGTNIVYTDYRSEDWGYDNGTLWILNINTGEKKQLTFNNVYSP